MSMNLKKELSAFGQTVLVFQGGGALGAYSRIHAFSRQDYYLIICGEGFDSWIRRNSPASTRFLGRIIILLMLVFALIRGSFACTQLTVISGGVLPSFQNFQF